MFPDGRFLCIAQKWLSATATTVELNNDQNGAEVFLVYIQKSICYYKLL